MKKKLNIGFIGLGGRGYGLLTTCVLPRPELEVLAVCDPYPDRAQKGAEAVAAAKGNSPLVCGDYREALALPGLDAVVVASAWESHVDIACAAMRAGLYVAVEVGGAYDLEDCWRLVRTHEETGAPCMMLENCCYGRDELMVLKMARQGLLGTLVHCQGGYRHDLRAEVANGEENRHYRLRNYLARNAENYPTHELGPIANILDINRGNRLLTLTATASQAAGLNAYLQREAGAGGPLANARFAQGDVVTTVIKCARGETITLFLDTTLPRAYSRGLQVQGTKGMYCEDNHSFFFDDAHQEFEFNWRGLWGNAEGYREKYEHGIWKRYLAEGVQGGHDGIDWLVFSAFFQAALSGGPVPIDVYDTAAWMSVTALSEASIAMGGAPQPVPDFTRGKWLQRGPSAAFDG